MIKIKIYTIGKTKEAWLQLALDEYQKRLQHSMSIQWKIVRNLFPIKEHSYICLDPCGKQFTSIAFSSFLQKEVMSEGAKLTFIIGGSQGIPTTVLAKARHVISFSKQTFTHQIVRLILVEQLYRSDQIQKGTHYHK